jgi:hypothetical protein
VPSRAGGIEKDLLQELLDDHRCTRHHAEGRRLPSGKNGDIAEGPLFRDNTEYMKQLGLPK